MRIGKGFKVQGFTGNGDTLTRTQNPEPMTISQLE